MRSPARKSGKILIGVGAAMKYFNDGSAQLTTDEAKKLLERMGFKRDYNIVQSDAEYYFREKHPQATFDVPRERDLSKNHSRKLLQLYQKYIKH
jgi:hypothetical protein